MRIPLGSVIPVVTLAALANHRLVSGYASGVRKSDKLQTCLRRVRFAQKWLNLSVLILNRQQKHAISKTHIRRFLKGLTTALNLADREFSVVFVTDDFIRSFNRVYRGFDKPTDVLSFCGDDPYLGDILISAETAYNQARRSRTLDFERTLRRLMLHGLLHLMGHDHETDNGEMRAIERRLRRQFQC